MPTASTATTTSFCSPPTPVTTHSSQNVPPRGICVRASKTLIISAISLHSCHPQPVEGSVTLAFDFTRSSTSLTFSTMSSSGPLRQHTTPPKKGVAYFLIPLILSPFTLLPRFLMIKYRDFQSSKTPAIHTPKTVNFLLYLPFSHGYF